MYEIRTEQIEFAIQSDELTDQFVLHLAVHQFIVLSYSYRDLSLIRMVACRTPHFKAVIPLGICRTRTIAERKGAEKIEQLGINSTQRFIEVTSTITFKRQAEIWLTSLAKRKRNPLEQTTIDTRRYALDKWIYPFFEGKLLADVNNLAMKEFVEHISELAPATIRDYSNVVKAIVASAINEHGEELFPQTWNEEFIDAPAVERQKQPSTDKGRHGEHFEGGEGRYRMLYALLAGCGPLRAGEALGLEIDKQISEDCRTLYIREARRDSNLHEDTERRAGNEEPHAIHHRKAPAQGE